MLPAKHGRHIGIMTPSGLAAFLRRPGCHTIGLRLIILEGMHKFHSNFTEGSSITKYRSNSKRG